MSLVKTFVRFFRSLVAGYKDPDLRGLIELMILIVCFSATFYHFVEGWSWLDSFYFSVTTLVTVGFGDLAPITPIGKIFTVVYIFIGVGAFFGFINLYTEHHRGHTSQEK